MTLGIPQRDIAYKKQDSATANTLRVARSGSTPEAIEALSQAEILVKLRCHVSLIGDLTGLPQTTLRSLAKKLFKASEHGSALMRTGRLPTSLGEVLMHPSLHVETTLFLRTYRDCLLAEEITPEPGPAHTPSLIRAFYVTQDVFKRSVLAETEEGAVFAEDRRLQLSYAHLTAVQDHEGLLTISRCNKCLSSYIKLKSPIRIGDSQGVGTCPVCRTVAAQNLKGKQTQVPDAARRAEVKATLPGIAAELPETNAKRSG